MGCRQSHLSRLACLWHACLRIRPDHQKEQGMELLPMSQAVQSKEGVRPLPPAPPLNLPSLHST